ncbi:MAG: ribonuclease H family protein [Tissierella sp.]|uniref:ribonuclease H family protein n=1 Tax=Tissierella sp. TaxID=41274 RepID=UPI003F9623ED
MSKYFYAVKVGNAPGVYNTWGECEKQVKGFKGAKFKKFKTYEEALAFIGGNNIGVREVKKEIEIKKEENEFEEGLMLEDEMIAYVDGSFSLKHMLYSYGAVIITKSGMETFKGKDDDPELVKMRNVSGELKGAMVAMSIAIDKNYQKLSLHYDYAGIEKWAIGEWKTNKEGTKFYKKYYDSIKDKLDVKFVKVKAHSGVKYNELADKLAKEAIEDGLV